MYASLKKENNNYTTQFIFSIQVISLKTQFIFLYSSDLC